jgi:hypothetical protein
VSDSEDWIAQKGASLLVAGRRAYGQARYLSQIGGPDAEAKARGSLEVLRSAMNWLEGTPAFEDAHQLIDEAGRFIRETFGCHLLLENGRYFQTCPAALAHNRAGLSIGYVVQAQECSICGEDPEDCAHITGRHYGDTMCHRRITKADMLEVSLVNRPQNPDARITSISLSTPRLQDRLGPQWRPGIPVNCDNCLVPCDGVFEPDFGDHGPLPTSGEIAALRDVGEESKGESFEMRIL